MNKLKAAAPLAVVALFSLAAAQEFFFSSDRILNANFHRQFEIFLYRDGSELRITTTPDLDEYDPVASDDGGLVAYAAKERGGDFAQENGGVWIFEVVDPLLGRQLAHWEVPNSRGMSRPAGSFNLAWLADGRSLLGQVPSANGGWEIHRFTIGKAGSEVVTRGYGIVLSSDRQHLATERNGVVYVLELGTGRETALAAGIPLAWDDDGHLFVAKTDELELVDTKTQTARRLHTFYGEYVDLAWSPNREHYAFSLFQDGQWFIILVARDHTIVEDYLIPGAIYSLDWLDDRTVIFSFRKASDKEKKASDSDKEKKAGDKEAGDLAVALLDLDGNDPVLVDSWADDYGVSLVRR